MKKKYPFKKAKKGKKAMPLSFQVPRKWGLAARLEPRGMKGKNN